MTLLVVLACVGAVSAGRYFGPKFKTAKIDAKYQNRSKGNPKAELWIIEYMDFACPICSSSAKMIEAYVAKHPKEIYVQARYFPLIHNHRYGLKSAIYSECASRQKRYWEFTGKIFEIQSEWAESKDPDAIFQKVAAGIGLDVKALNACVDDPATKQIPLHEREEGKSLGVHSTPLFFLNGKRFEGPYTIKKELDDYFEKKNPPKEKTK